MAGELVKVYVISHSTYEEDYDDRDYEIDGVFATEEAVDKYIKDTYGHVSDMLFRSRILRREEFYVQHG